MIVALSLGSLPPRRWNLRLLERLAAIPDLKPCLARDAGITPASPSMAWPDLQRAVHGLKRDDAFAVVPAVESARWLDREGVPDLVIALDGDQPRTAARLWQLRFDGRPGEAGLLTSLTSSRAPLAEIVENGTVVAAGRLGTESGGLMRTALDDILTRLVTLIVAAFNGGSPLVPMLPDQAQPSLTPAGQPSGFPRVLARELAGSATGAVYRRLFHSPHWRIGWRKLDGADLFDLRRHPESGWRDLPDDGKRFFADPFPILHEGRLTLFVEEFPHATAKGIISAIEFGSDGPIGTPTPVLELESHLSYPFVFARDGEVWMIPESCGAGSVDLFRATAFPGGWVKERTLIDDIVASDATIIEHGGCWWLFATVRDGGGAYSDALCLWSAPDFRGPWTPHKRNPVLIDIGSARPAGRMVVRDGHLLRPVQDCRGGYGRALAIARVTRLDPEGFQQEVETLLTAGPLWPGRRLHSLNSAGGLEFIDGSARVLRKPF